MSTTTANNNAAKGEKGKKFAALNINILYKGNSTEPQAKLVSTKHGMQSLGKLPTARRAPQPVNLPSLKSESSGSSEQTSVVPSASNQSGWTESSSTQVSTSSQQTAASPSASPVSSSATQRPPAPAVANSSGQTFVDPKFQEEFPSLTGNPEAAKKATIQPASQQLSAEPQQYGPGPSLRPQTEGSWIQGGRGGPSNQHPSSGEEIQRGPSIQTAQGGPGGNAGPRGGGPPPGHLPLAGPSPPPHPIRSVMPPFMVKGAAQGGGAAHFPSYSGPPPPIRGSGGGRYLQGEGRGGRPPPQRPVAVPADVELFQRPIIREEDLKSLDEISRDDGWAAVNDDIDYNKKLFFGDEEESNGQLEKKLAAREEEKKDRSGSWADNIQPQGRLLTSAPAIASRAQEEEFWSEKRRQQKDEEYFAAERARLRREEEERRFEIENQQSDRSVSRDQVESRRTDSREERQFTERDPDRERYDARRPANRERGYDSHPRSQQQQQQQQYFQSSLPPRFQKKQQQQQLRQHDDHDRPPATQPTKEIRIFRDADQSDDKSRAKDKEREERKPWNWNQKPLENSDKDNSDRPLSSRDAKANNVSVKDAQMPKDETPKASEAAGSTALDAEIVSWADEPPEESDFQESVSLLTDAEKRASKAGQYHAPTPITREKLEADTRVQVKPNLVPLRRQGSAAQSAQATPSASSSSEADKRPASEAGQENVWALRSKTRQQQEQQASREAEKPSDGNGAGQAQDHNQELKEELRERAKGLGTRPGGSGSRGGGRGGRRGGYNQDYDYDDRYDEREAVKSASPEDRARGGRLADASRNKDQKLSRFGQDGGAGRRRGGRAGAVGGPSERRGPRQGGFDAYDAENSQEGAGETFQDAGSAEEGFREVTNRKVGMKERDVKAPRPLDDPKRRRDKEVGGPPGKDRDRMGGNYRGGPAVGGGGGGGRDKFGYDNRPPRQSNLPPRLAKLETNRLRQRDESAAAETQPQQKETSPASPNVWEKAQSSSPIVSVAAAIAPASSPLAADAAPKVLPSPGEEKEKEALERNPVLDGSTPPVQTIIFENTNFKGTTATGAGGGGSRPGSKAGMKPEVSSKAEGLQLPLTFGKEEMQLNFSFETTLDASATAPAACGGEQGPGPGPVPPQPPVGSKMGSGLVARSMHNVMGSNVLSPISPSTADLNMKIASVKKVWDIPAMSTVLEHGPEDQSPAVSASGSVGGGAFPTFSSGVESESPLSGTLDGSSHQQQGGLQAAKGDNAGLPNVCKVKPQQQPAIAPPAGPLSPPPNFSSAAPASCGIPQAPSVSQGSAGSTAGPLGYHTHFGGMPAVPSPPGTVLFNSQQLPTQAAAGIYQPFQLDSSQFSLLHMLGAPSQVRSQFSQFAYSVSSTSQNVGQLGSLGNPQAGLANPAAAFGQSSMFLQQPPPPSPAAPPGAPTPGAAGQGPAPPPAPYDLYQSSFRMQPSHAPFGQSQHTAPGAVLLSGNSSLGSMKSSQNFGSIGQQNFGSIGTKTYQQAPAVPQHSQMYFPFDPSQQVMGLGQNFLPSSQLLQQRPAPPVQTIQPPPSSFCSVGPAGAGVGSHGNQAGYYQPTGGPNLSQVPPSAPGGPFSLTGFGSQAFGSRNPQQAQQQLGLVGHHYRNGHGMSGPAVSLGGLAFSKTTGTSPGPNHSHSHMMNLDSMQVHGINDMGNSNDKEVSQQHQGGMNTSPKMRHKPSHHQQHPQQHQQHQQQQQQNLHQQMAKFANASNAYQNAPLRASGFVSVRGVPPPQGLQQQQQSGSGGMVPLNAPPRYPTPIQRPSSAMTNPSGQAGTSQNPVAMPGGPPGATLGMRPRVPNPHPARAPASGAAPGHPNPKSGSAGQPFAGVRNSPTDDGRPMVNDDPKNADSLKDNSDKEKNNAEK